MHAVGMLSLKLFLDQDQMDLLSGCQMPLPVSDQPIHLTSNDFILEAWIKGDSGGLTEAHYFLNVVFAHSEYPHVSLVVLRFTSSSIPADTCMLRDSD